MKIHYNIIQWTPEWKEIRKGKLTGTKLKWILWYTEKRLPKWDGDAIELIAEKNIDDPELSAMEIMERWNYLEWFARREYEQKTWLTVTEVWFIEDESWYIWLSPDGIIDNWLWVYTWAVEFKSPMWKKYVRYLKEDIIPNEYKAQVINYFLVIDTLEWLDFCIYNPDVISNLPKFHIIRITREQLQKEIAKAKVDIQKFREKWLEIEDTLFSKYKNINEGIMINPTHYYSVSEVATIAKVSQQTIRSWCNTGKLSAKNIGTEKRKTFRVHWEDLINFLDSKK